MIKKDRTETELKAKLFDTIIEAFIDGNASAEDVEERVETCYNYWLMTLRLQNK